MSVSYEKTTAPQWLDDKFLNTSLDLIPNTPTKQLIFVNSGFFDINVPTSKIVINTLIDTFYTEGKQFVKDVYLNSLNKIKLYKNKNIDEFILILPRQMEDLVVAIFNSYICRYMLTGVKIPTISAYTFKRWNPEDTEDWEHVNGFSNKGPPVF